METTRVWSSVEPSVVVRLIKLNLIEDLKSELVGSSPLLPIIASLPPLSSSFLLPLSSSSTSEKQSTVHEPLES